MFEFYELSLTNFIMDFNDFNGLLKCESFQFHEFRSLYLSNVKNCSFKVEVYPNIDLF